MVPSFHLTSRAQAGLIWLAMLPVAFAQAQPGVQVPVAEVRGQAVSAGFEMDGVIQPVRQSTVAAQASGRVLNLAVKVGDRVRSGQLLLTIDDRELVASVQRSRAQVSQSEAELRNAQQHLERTRELQAQGFVSKAALDTAQNQFNGAQAGKEQASAGARQAALAQGHTRVVAPYDGWVLQTHVNLGDLAMPGTPLVTVYAPQPLRAVVQLPASRAQAITPAAQVEVMVGGEWVAPSSRSSMPSADPVAQTVEWRLDLGPKVSQTLLPGAQVRVRFAAGQSQRMVLPASAVLRRGELTAVYVATAKGFVLRAVRLGADHGVQGVEVLAGVSAGERVALDPVKAGLSGAQAVTGVK